MSDVRDLVGNIAQTNHYLVSFSILNENILEHLVRYTRISDPREFLSRKTGLLCSDASLPTSSLATGEVKDNFMGIPQEFAHTRIYTDIDFTFYVDTDYTNLMIFEGWMDYISSGSQNEVSELSENYYRRFQYPDNYKVQSMYISKFEKDYQSQIDYQFINAFPKTITAIPVSYGPADLLKVSVSFNYDRYVMNPKGRYKKSRTSSFMDLSNPIDKFGNKDLTQDNRRYDVKNFTDAERNKMKQTIVKDKTGTPSYVFDAKTQAALDALADK